MADRGARRRCGRTSVRSEPATRGGGLTLRPLAHSVRAVLAERAAAEPAAGAAARLTQRRESELLAAWHEGAGRAVH